MKKVICINDQWVHILPKETYPVKGKVYTIREIVTVGTRSGYRFEEIRNPLFLYHGNPFERAFTVNSFRPLTLNDSAIGEILEKVKVVEEKSEIEKEVKEIAVS